MLPLVTEKWKRILPFALMAVFALSRIPGILPPNFSAAYALMFCCGVFFSGSLAWWLPLVTMLLTDVGLNFYYQLALHYDVWTKTAICYQLFNYLAYGVLIFLGRQFKPKSSFVSLLGGGLLGALLFYVITNTASWLFNPFQNPEYTKTLLGFLTALIKGTAGWPETWQFFKHTMFSGGIFTALFVGAMKITADAESPADKTAGARDGEPEKAPEPEEAKA